MAHATAFLRSACILAAAAGASLAGPLDPPAGPIAPTMKTLAEVEPRTAINAVNTPGDADSLYRISQPGSYVLTGDLGGVAGKRGIEIACSDVSIDLGGFSLRGVAGSLDGIGVIASNLRNITVENGGAFDWGGDGIDLVGTASGNTACAVRNVRSGANALHGIRVSNSSSITDCVCTGNIQRGFDAFSNCTITNCQASDNGLSGFDTAGGCNVTGCTAFSNGGRGIKVNGQSVVSRCIASSNSDYGITGQTSCRISDCVVSQNAAGILATNRSVIIGNNCTENLGAGLGAGIEVSGSDSRVEGNTCAGNGRGVVVSLAGNVIVKNTCAGNTTNWVIAANNVFGPIVDRTAPASGAVSGNSAPSSLGTTDANANLTY